MQHSAESIFAIESNRIESTFKTALALESWHPGVPLNEKIEGRKSHDTVPLIQIECWISNLSFINFGLNSACYQNGGSQQLEVWHSLGP
jgi:hypothetical protein